MRTGGVKRVWGNLARKCLAGMPFFLNPENFVFRSSAWLVRHYLPHFLLDLTHAASIRKYSKTSLQKADNLCTVDTSLAPVDFTITLIHFDPPRSGHLSPPNNGPQPPPLTNPSQYKITSENGQWSFDHIMRMLVYLFHNATVAGFKDWALYYHHLVIKKKHHNEAE